ncbi:MAG: hypothetical protein JXA09_10835 [Anaerolineae bacterium]|nr:hypothetical protein [Anaerolineae bacterium]
MSDPLNLKHIERRVWRDVQQDGMIELMLGLLFLLASSYLYRQLLVLPFLLFLFFAPRAIEAVRARYTYPRIGYVALVSETPGVTFRGIAIYALIVVAAMALVLLIAGRVADIDTWTQWVPALVGVLFSGGFLYAAGKSGAARYYLFIVLAVGLGVVFSLFFAGSYIERMQRYLLVLGGVFTIWGAIMFLLFLRYPVREEVNDVGR